MNYTEEILDNRDRHCQVNNTEMALNDNLQIEISSMVLLSLLKENKISLCYCRSLNQRTQVQLRKLLVKSIFI
jgi:hypothetical protein